MSEDKKPYISVIDTETSVNCPIGNNKAHPKWPGNNIVAMGVAPIGEPSKTPFSCNYNAAGLHKTYYTSANIKGEQYCYIGHNIPFDLMHCRNLPGYGKYLRDASSRDTAIAEYLLSAQQERFPSLDRLASKYGFPMKDNAIAAAWDAGVKTEDIPSAQLLEYLNGDVMTTKGIFEKQAMLLKDKGLIPLFRSQCEAQHAVTEMMYNGMHVDKEILRNLLMIREHELKITKGAIISLVGYDIDLNSPKQMSLLFFGGEEKYKVSEHDGHSYYKNGKPKHRTVEKVKVHPGLGITMSEVGATLGKNGYYSVDDNVLKNIATMYSGQPHAIAYNMRKYRELEKEISTYLLPLQELIFPDSKIYGNINTTATVTGRYSSSNPNLQNITDYSQVKSVFVSRFEGGKIIEADFNQLEIVGLAYLSQDKQLIEDINSGKDIHTELYKEAFHRVPSKAQRKPFKSVTFATIYGAGVNKIAEQTGLTVSEVKAFVAAFKFRYAGVVKWWETTKAHVEAGRFVTGLKDEEGIPVGESILVSAVTGRQLYFREYQNKYASGWGVSLGTRNTTFSPSQIKNYPVQSFATGDVVPMVLGRVYRALMKNELLRDSCVLINTVHDSIVLDCKGEVVPNAIKLLLDVMPRVGDYLEEDFGVTDFNVRVGVSVRAGVSWKEKPEEDVTASDYYLYKGSK
jgi:DNA polymerase I-like protein with 3'-5' exonuclease and polymerase domains